MQKISIVIVSYNVKYFLRQCIQSILKSKVDAALEIIVVDNASTDGSVKMIREQFSNIHCIANDKNLGFSKANNQAFRIAQGDFILILNPDTIIEENTLQSCLNHMSSHPDTAMIGVRMVDGRGQFLPESKRGFPTPLNALFKIFGFSSLFSKSKLFNAYYLGHTSQNEIQKVDVLTGAFMFARKPILDEIEGFDEDYFMYGEDIELCYQIHSLGKDIIYLPTSTIVHFKGESTKKSSLKYLKSFYGAMQIYSSKRSNRNSAIWKLVLNIGIFITALSNAIATLFSYLVLPIVAICSLFLLTKALQKIWASYYFNDPNYFDYSSNNYTIGFLCGAIVGIYYFWGLFDKKYTVRQWLFSAVSSLLIMLSFYGLFPQDWRFSRSILILLLGLSPLIMILFRMIFNRINSKSWRLFGDKVKRIFVLGSKSSFEKIYSIIDLFYTKIDFVKRIDVQKDGSEEFDVNHFASMVRSYKINEIIYCSYDILTEDIFKTMAHLDSSINFKIASSDNSSILGSHSKNTVGEWFTLDFDFKINQEFHRRTKRWIDLVASMLVILLLPYFVIIKSKYVGKILKDLLSIIFNNKTWISYDFSDDNIDNLPALKPGVFSFKFFETEKAHPPVHKQNIFYAQNYSVWLEGDQIFNHLKRL